MSRLEELIQELCPDGVEYCKIRDVCSDVIVPMRDRPKVFDGDIPWCRIEDKEGRYFHKSLSGLGVSEKIVSDMNLKIFPTGTVICSCSASIGSYAINTQPLVTNQTFIGLVCGDRVINKFLLYYMETQTRYLKSQATTGTIPYISRKKFEEMTVPVPPVSVQEEIVRILDAFTELEEKMQVELQIELNLRKKQYEYYRNRFLNYCESTLRMSLGEIGPVNMCKRILKTQTNADGGVPFYKIGTFGKEADAFISCQTYEEYKKKYNFPKKGDVLISAAGTIGRTVVYDGEPAYFQDSNIVWINNDETKVLNSFLVYCYSMRPWKISEGGTIPRLYNENILNAVIPVPTLEQQRKIVEELTNLDILFSDIDLELSKDIEVCKKQYEYYRDELLTFKEKSC